MFGLRSAARAILALTQTLQIGQALALPTTNNQIYTENSFDCVFSVPSEGATLKYDLCLLLKREQYQVSRDVETPPSRTKIHYDINLGANIAWDGTLPSRDQCSQGTNICMTVISERPDHRLEPPRVIYVVPVAGNLQGRELNVTSKIARQQNASQHAPLQITLHGGMYMGILQKAIFTFHCDPSAQEPSMPTLTSHGDPLEDQGKHKLAWTSRHACPIGGYPEKQPVGAPDSSAPDQPPVQVPQPPKSSNWGLATFLFIFVVGALVVGKLRKRFLRTPNTQRYRSLALSHIGPALHHEPPADPRSPLTPQMPDGHHTRRYTVD